MKKLLHGLLLMVMITAMPAYATVLLYENFDGSSAEDLNGIVADVNETGNATWIAHTDWKADGSLTHGTNAICATLPFTPQVGYLYELTASGLDASDGQWVGIGFATGSGTDSGDGYRFINDPVRGNPWFLTRTKNVTTYESQAFMGPGTGGGANIGYWYEDDVDVRVYLDTQPSLWEVTYQIRYAGDPTFSTVRTASYTTNPTIASLGFAVNEDTTLTVGSLVLKAYGNDASGLEPLPADGGTNIPTSTTLSWNKIPDADSYKLYIVPDEPNFVGISPTDVSQAAGDRVEVSPPITLELNKTYYWYVETVPDPNYSSPIWFFDMAVETPIVLTNPSDTEVFIDESAQFSGAFASGTEPSVVWYKDDTTVLGTVTTATSPVANGRYTLELTDLGGGEYETVLTIDNLIVDDHTTTYHFKVTNTYGDKTSTAGQLAIKRLLAWYQFEENADDSTGTNDGTVVGLLNYPAGAVTSDGQQYAAEPNHTSGSSYVELSTSAYPKKGLGNGMVAGTVSAWVKIDGFVPGEGVAQIIGVWNESTYTAFMFFVADSTPPTLNFRMYAGTASAIETSVSLPADIIGDDTWHLLAVTYREGDVVQFYVDGEPVGDPTSLDSGWPYTDWDQPVLLGASSNRGTPNGFWDGLLDDLRIYNYPLDMLTIADMYLAVYPDAKLCLLEYASDFDTDGPEGTPDCAVDLYDFADLASHWLDCGFYPSCL